MRNAKSWPDAANLGFPANPEREGPHLIVDQYGKRRWFWWIYTTHSPFMVHVDRLHQIRVVEDKVKEGTVISANVTGSDPRTIFPLQAALGWTIAQSLFISKRNLLVEGPADLLYLMTLSGLLEAAGRQGLREDITIVPVGGLDKVATFIALLGANDLELAVFHDYSGTPDQRLVDLVKQKLVASKVVLNASEFRDTAKLGTASAAADLEDMIEPALYLEYFGRAFAHGLKGVVPTLADLPPGDRIVARLDAWLVTKGINLRKSGGFNHYAVASQFSQHPPAAANAEMLRRFEALFEAVNALFKS